MPQLEISDVHRKSVITDNPCQRLLVSATKGPFVRLVIEAQVICDFVATFRFCF